jgi:acyl carrier protein
MNESSVRTAVMGALHRIVPDVELAALRSDLSLRDQVDMDSIDFLRLLVAIQEATGVEIPETDYACMRSLDDTVTYLVRHTGQTQAQGTDSA